jgi:hypothetical protein
MAGNISQHVPDYVQKINLRNSGENYKRRKGFFVVSSSNAEHVNFLWTFEQEFISKLEKFTQSRHHPS